MPEHFIDIPVIRIPLIVKRLPELCLGYLLLDLQTLAPQLIVNARMIQL